MKILVIIPAYNEQDNIEKVVGELCEVRPDVDYIVINDCSTDKTLEILRQKHICHINLPVNLGIGGGVQTGFRYAVENGYDIAIQLDGDGQHDPRYIEAIIAPVVSGECDMCIGSRFIEQEGFQSSALRRFGIRVLKTLIRLCCGVSIEDTTSGFRAVNRNLAEYFSHSYAQDYPEPEAIVSAVVAGYNVKETAVEMRERQGGMSSIHTFKSAYYMLKVSIAILLYTFSRKARRN